MAIQEWVLGDVVRHSSYGIGQVVKVWQVKGECSWPTRNVAKIEYKKRALAKQSTKNKE